MKTKLLNSVMLIALLTVSIGTVKAQEDPADKGWSFSGNMVNVDDMRYKLDSTNGLAECCFYSSDDMAPETLTVPATITYNDKSYQVVSVSGNSYSNTQKATKKLVLPASLVRIGRYAFRQFPNVASFDIPASVKILEQYAFGYNRNEVYSFSSIVAPEVRGTLTSSKLVKIYVPGEAFRNYSTADYFENQCIISKDLSVTTVNTGKVDNGELGYIVVGDALPQVRTYADVNVLVCDQGTIDETDFRAMRQMRNLIKVDLSGLNITELPKNAFYDCWQLEEVILPPTLKTIRSQAFRNAGIKKITLPDGLENITDGTNFKNCDNLNEIIIPNSVLTLPSECFQDCDSLHKVTLPNSLTSMGSYCFQNCDLYEVVFPGTLKQIPAHGFASNENLKSITLSEGIQQIESYAFAYCYAMESLTTPTSLRSIGNGAFSYNKGIKTINFGEGLETITQGSFSGCEGLTELTLPSSLLYCLNNPFGSCNNIQKIEARSLIPPTVRGNIPTSAANNIELYVPLWSFQEYMTTPGWLEYQDHTHLITDNLPENIFITKDFQFVLDDKTNVEGYTPNIRLMQSKEQIDDGFGHQRYERGNLTISSRSKMTINHFAMYYSPYAKWHSDYSLFGDKVDYDNQRTQYSPNSLINRGQMRAEDQTLNLMLANNLWQFVSFPFDVAMQDIVPVDSKTQWVVRRYDGEARAAQKFDETWVNVPSDGVLKAGVGYIMMCYNSDFYSTTTWSIYEPIEFTVKPVLNSVNRQLLFDASNRTITLSEFDTEFEQNRSWNLVGNPFPSYFDSRYIDTETPFLVWNSRDKSYVAFSPVDDNYIFSPGEAFFIQCPVDNNKLTFLANGRQTYRNPNDLKIHDGAKARKIRKANANRTVFNIMLQGQEQSDRTRVVFNDMATAEYEISRDAVKMMPMDNGVSQLWTVNGNVKYAINERPETTDELPLALYIGKEGTYTIALGVGSASQKLYLSDKELGVVTELTEEGYEFTANRGQVEGRFSLTISKGDETAIHSINQTAGTAAGIYNIEGVKVDDSYRGIIVKDGQKLLNK